MFSDMLQRVPNFQQNLMSRVYENNVYLISIQILQLIVDTNS